MLHLLIVDDETSVGETLTQSYPWEELGIARVHSVTSGAEALAYMEQHAVDVMITDIRMPEMSGIELLGEVMARWPRVKTILLSGYADFNYAQQAMHYQPVCYLLKPVRDRELLDAVRQACDKVHQEWQEASSLTKANQILRDHLPVLRQMLLADLFMERISLGEFHSRSKEYGIDYQDGECFYLFVLRSDVPGANWSGTSLYDFAAANIAREVFGSQYELMCCRSMIDELVFVLQPRERERAGLFDAAAVGYIEELVLKLQGCIKQYLKSSESAILGGAGLLPDGLTEVYKACQDAFRTTVLRETEYVLYASRTTEATAKALNLSALYEPPQLYHLFYAGRWEEAEEKLKVLFACFESEANLLPEHVMEIDCTIMAALLAVCHLHGYRFSELAPEQFELLTGAGRTRSLQQIKDISFAMLQRLSDSVNRGKRRTHRQLVQQLQAYIEAHLDQDISLQILAEQVHMHPVYLSQLYKAETNEGISDYLLRSRMERAYYLLRNGRDKVQDVATESGYSNTSYFIRVFKQYFGQTPQECRDGAGS